jgi:hypothetical protein
MNGITYVVQPGLTVTSEVATGSPRIFTGNDGFLRFIDSVGNSQILYPAFSEPSTLRKILQGLDATSSFTIQTDGTAQLLLNGQRYTLVPDITLGDIPSIQANSLWWQESPTRFHYKSTQQPNRSVGFSVRQ